MMTRRTTFATALAVALAAAGTAAGLLLSGGHAQKGTRPAVALQPRGKATYAELVAANYKILKPRQTRRLLEYADAAYACLSKELDLGTPKISAKKIVMALPNGSTPAAVVKVSLRCAAKIGDPPPDASFQVRSHAVLLYVPKRCILDKRTVARANQLPPS
jgi:hypothetical protein